MTSEPPAKRTTGNAGCAPAFAVAQLGSRLHYAVACALQSVGRLDRLYTDICATQGWPRVIQQVPHLPGVAALRRLADRIPEGVPVERIVTFPWLGLRYWLQVARAKTIERRVEVLWCASSAFCRQVADRLGDVGGVYVHNQCGLEVLRAARDLGCAAVLEQASAPVAVAFGHFNEHCSSFRDWGEGPYKVETWAPMIRREEAEWALAERILCPSRYVVDGIRQVGGPAEKCIVVPYGVGDRFYVERSGHAGPLRVLTVGKVSVSKGSPFVLDAARRLGHAANFRMVGPHRLPTVMENELRRHVELVGAVPRSEVSSHLAWADVFLHPSLSEGSATVIYEALMAGLPVVCTPNSGSIVTDGVDGILVPCGDGESIALALERLIRAPDLLRAMAEAAQRTASSCTLRAYRARLLTAIDQSAPESVVCGGV